MRNTYDHHPTAQTASLPPSPEKRPFMQSLTSMHQGMSEAEMSFAERKKRAWLDALAEQVRGGPAPLCGLRQPWRSPPHLHPSIPRSPDHRGLCQGGRRTSLPHLSNLRRISTRAAVAAQRLALRERAPRASSAVRMPVHGRCAPRSSSESPSVCPRRSTT